MNEKKDFLTLLRRDNVATGETYGEHLKSPTEVYLCLRVLHGIVFMSLTDSRGRAINLSQYEIYGAKGPLMKAMESLTQGNPMDFSWDGDNQSDELSTSAYPFLASFIPSWEGYIINPKGEHLELDREPRRLVLRISQTNPDTDEKSSELKGEFIIRNEERGENKGENKEESKSEETVAKRENNEKTEETVSAFVSDSFVITGNRIRTIQSVGDRFGDLTTFLSPFYPDMLESYLSIFFTTVTNVNVEYAGRKVKFVDDHVQSVPTLIIEKVDVDNSLYLRVSEAIGSLPPDICDNFLLTRIASVTDHHIYVRPLAKSTLAESVNLLTETLNAGLGKREQKQIWNEGTLFVVPPEIASKFLYNSFAGLLGTFRILGAEKLKSYKIVAARPKLNLSLGSGIDYLEGKADVEIGGENFTLRDLLSQYGRNRYVTLSDGNRAVLDSDYMKRLQRIFRNNPKDSNEIKISFFDLPEVMELLDDKEKQSRSFKTYRDFYEGFNSLGSKRCSTPGLKAKLRDYQKAGLKWINYLYNTGMGGCLADDMGLGKTVQTIAMLTISVPKATKPTLIVMPRSLLFNWQEELRKFAPDLKVSTHYGTGREFAKSMEAQVVLTTYAIVRSDIEQFMKQEFDYVILDESQNIKNVDALVTKSVWLLKADHRLALSGTPIENNLTELYSLFHFLNPAMFGSLQDFGTLYAGPIQRNGDEEAATALRRKVFPFILRRLKQDVLSDLPDRTDQVLMVDMSPRQAALYEERRRYFAGEINQTIAREGIHKASFMMLQALGELRQIASIPEEKSDGAIHSPKIDLLMEYLVSAVRNGHKVAVFFNFLAGIELTGEKLDREGIGYETMTGATRDRKRAVQRFQEDDDCRVMLMTVKTGGVGLNLVAADTVFIVEPWWNKAAEEQAINRLHRIGQKKAVNCYYLITADTIEEKIRELQEKKSALVDTVISSDSTGGKSLSAEEISFLLS